MNVPLRRLAAPVALALGLLPLVVPDATATELVLRAPFVRGTPGATVDVPIQVTGADGMEGLQFVLTFDPALLRYVEVALGPLAGAGTVDAKVRRPGEVRVAMYPEATLRDDGTLLLATFEVLGTPGARAALGLADARAWEFREAYPLEMLVSTQPGEVSIVAVAALSPWMFFAALGGVVMLLLLAVLGRASRRRKRAEVPGS